MVYLYHTFLLRKVVAVVVGLSFFYAFQDQGNHGSVQFGWQKEKCTKVFSKGRNLLKNEREKDQASYSCLYQFCDTSVNAHKYFVTRLRRGRERARDSIFLKIWTHWKVITWTCFNPFQYTQILYNHLIFLLLATNYLGPNWFFEYISTQKQNCHFALRST